jgi:tetratricopeptide (TPR) repeat protein
MSNTEIIDTSLRQLLLTYRDEWLNKQWTLPEYTISVDGPDVIVDLMGTQISGRISSWIQLVGEFWAVAAESELGMRFNRLIPDFTLGGRTRWSSHLYQVEKQLRPQLVAAVRALVRQGEDLEAALCLYRFFKASTELRQLLEGENEPGFTEIENLLFQVEGNPSPLPDSTGYQSRFQALAEWIVVPDPLEQFKALQRLEWWLMWHSDENRSVKISATLDKALMRNLENSVPLVREGTIGAISRLARTLWSDRAHKEALLWLEKLVEQGEGIAINLYRLFETHLALGNTEESETAWGHFEIASQVWPEHLIDVNIFDRGNHIDARVMALTRVAKDHLRLGKDRDPCNQHRKKLRLSDAQKREHVLRAEQLIDEAISLVKPDMKKWLKKGKKEKIDYRHFSSVPFYIKGRLLESTGDLKGALQMYKQAQRIARILAMEWRKDDYDDDVDRLEIALKR